MEQDELPHDNHQEHSLPRTFLDSASYLYLVLIRRSNACLENDHDKGVANVESVGANAMKQNQAADSAFLIIERASMS
jgi:hypothetical protein